jgi:hypothetical protein
MCVLSFDGALGEMFAPRAEAIDVTISGLLFSFSITAAMSETSGVAVSSLMSVIRFTSP